MPRYGIAIRLAHPRTRTVHQAGVEEAFGRAVDAGQVEPWSVVPPEAYARLVCCRHIHPVDDFLVVPRDWNDYDRECQN